MNMTHTLRYIALALLMGVTTACTAQNSSFKVTLQDFPQQQQLVLNEVVGSQLRPLDTLTANGKGEVEANVMLEQPAFYVLHPLNLACTDIHVLLLPKEKAQMTVKLLNQNNMFRVVSATFDSKADAVQSRDKIRGAKFNPNSDAWLLYNVQ